MRHPAVSECATLLCWECVTLLCWGCVILLWGGVRGLLQVQTSLKDVAPPHVASALNTCCPMPSLSGLAACAQVSAGAGVTLPGLAAASQLGRLADLQELDLQGAGTTDAFLADLATAAPRLTR